jgi:hypothetical protein
VEFNRRNHLRVPLTGMLAPLRQCDLFVCADGEECDVLIEDISPAGACLLLPQDAPLSPGVSVFFRGCIFNGLIGFLSSTRAVVRWMEPGRCGVAFEDPLELACMTLSRMVRAESCPNDLHPRPAAV